MMFPILSCECIAQGTMFDDVRGKRGTISPREQQSVFGTKEYYTFHFEGTKNFIHNQYLGKFEFMPLQKYDEVIDKNGLTYVVGKDYGSKVECMVKGDPNKGYFTFHKLDILVIDDLFDNEEYNFQSLPITKPMSKLKQIMAESYMDAAKTNEVILLAKQLKERIDSLRKTKEEIDSHLENSESMLERIEEAFETPDKEVMEPLLYEAKELVSNPISISY